MNSKPPKPYDYCFIFKYNKNAMIFTDEKATAQILSKSDSELVRLLYKFFTSADLCSSKTYSSMFIDLFFTYFGGFDV